MNVIIVIICGKETPAPAMFRCGGFSSLFCFGCDFVVKFQNVVFDKIDAQQVNGTANAEYKHNRDYRVEIHRRSVVIIHNFQSVIPKPCTHGFAVTVNQQHTVGCGAYGVDKFYVRQFQVSEEYKGCNCRCKRKGLV